MTTIEDVMRYAFEAGYMDRRMCIGKAQGFDVSSAYDALRAAIEQYAAERVKEAMGGCMWAVTKGGTTLCQPPRRGLKGEARKPLTDEQVWADEGIMSANAAAGLPMPVSKGRAPTPGSGLSPPACGFKSSLAPNRITTGPGLG
jgi:hypothetical protein